MEAAVGAKPGVDPALFTDPELKRADNQLFVDEKARLMVEKPEPWPPNARPVKDTARIKAWSPEIAKQIFLERFDELDG